LSLSEETTALLAVGLVLSLDANGDSSSDLATVLGGAGPRLGVVARASGLEIRAHAGAANGFGDGGARVALLSDFDDAVSAHGKGSSRRKVSGRGNNLL
jgi:hypothetical protein